MTARHSQQLSHGAYRRLSVVVQVGVLDRRFGGGALAIAKFVHRDGRPTARASTRSCVGSATAPADIPDDGQFIAKPYHLDMITNLIASLPRS